MLCFLVAQLAVNGLSSSPVWPTRFSFDPRLTPWGEPGHHYGPNSLVRLFYWPHGGCPPVSMSVPWACVLGLWAAFILGTISCPPAFCRSELGQGLNRFLDRVASSTWPDCVCWSRLVAVNLITIMMAFLDFYARFG